jgi:NTP pyrophosphatase (non-canonical NTP hydrolase)
MTFDEYQSAAHETAIYPQDVALAYVTMGLVGEAGEIANKAKKVYRDHGGIMSDDDKFVLAKELGDVLWYCAELASILDFDLSEVAKANIAKLQSRQERGKLGGSGDNR